MYHYTAIQWLFFFYFYCFFGWCFESTYVSLKSRKLVNRGFCRGPFLPLYGSGAIMMLVVSMPFQDNLVLVYIAGCIGATVLEYVTGVTMEALFKVRYWDYSKNKFNFQGHICLGASLAWGGLTILMTEFIHKPIEHPHSCDTGADGADRCGFRIILQGSPGSAGCTGEDGEGKRRYAADPETAGCYYCCDQ